MKFLSSHCWFYCSNNTNNDASNNTTNDANNNNYNNDKNNGNDSSHYNKINNVNSKISNNTYPATANTSNHNSKYLNSSNLNSNYSCSESSFLSANRAESLILAIQRKAFYLSIKTIEKPFAYFYKNNMKLNGWLKSDFQLY